MTHITNGFSPAGRRIHEAGLAFEAANPAQEPEAEPEPQWPQSRKLSQRQIDDAVAERKRIVAEERERLRAEMERKRAAAVQAALDSGTFSDDDQPRQYPTVRQIIDEVAAWHGLRPVDLASHRRAKPLVYARQEAMWRAACETTRSFRAIGKMMGHRDHSTIYYGARAHATRNDLPLPRGMKPLEGG